MNAIESVPLAVPVLYLVIFMTEAKFEVRKFPTVENWKNTGFIFFILLLLMSLMVPLVLPMAWFESNSLINLEAFYGSDVIIGLLLSTFCGYWFHRAEHQWDFMWKSFHQIHHSAERVDIAGAFYTHPFEPLAKMSLGVIVSLFILGLDPLSVVIVSTFSGLLSIFQHWNIKSPYWLGFIIPRPESHCLHHEINVHARNYGDLPIWDMLFGTFNNPRSLQEIQVGLGGNKLSQLKNMLFMKLVD